MALNVKSPGKLENDLLKHLSHASPIIILDTGGLIDIVQATRDFSLYANGKRHLYPHYTRATSFLKNLSSKIPLFITPKTYQEIQKHGEMRLNSHEVELSQIVVDYALGATLSSARLIGNLTGESNFDEARYDAHWASLEGSIGNDKKMNEKCSDTDKEILSVAAYLSTCYKPESPGQKINPVLVVSPDFHVINGSKFLRREFDEKYSGIVPISTRE